ncbi:MAG: hypothetical protein LIQ30_06255 [Planctomycetes bacterium]|nr:hypothetical protein [Planctomycetota bacterium]
MRVHGNGVFGVASAGERPVAERLVHLAIWGGSVQELGREIHYQTGVRVDFHDADAEDSPVREPVYLVSGQVPLSVVFETVARRYGLRFRITADGGVQFARGYDWVADSRELRFLRLRPLAGPGLPADDTRKLLAELLKPLALLSGDYSVGLEPYPLPDDTNALRALALLPPVLGDYLERAVACLQGANGDYPPNPVRPAAFAARARPLSGDWESLLGRTLASPRGSDLKTILSDVADQAGVAVMLVTPPAEMVKPLPPDIDRYTFGRVTDVLARERGLGKRVFIADGGVVFEPGEDGTFETDGRSREFFWEGLAVAGFSVRAAVRQFGDAAALTAAIRREVFPSVWRDAVCGLAYSPATERLAVIAPENVVQAVALWLEGVQ